MGKILTLGLERMIPALMFCWSLVIIGSGFMHNAGELYTTRLLLGVFEAGMYPCLSLYLTTFYKPSEQALRVSYMFVSAALSGAFGGLFAYALLKMDGVAGYAGWRWLYIIEGCASVVVSIFVYLFLPNSCETARFLTEEDKKLMRVRAALMTRYNGNSVMEFSEIKKGLLDVKTWLGCWSQFWADICSFGFSTFLPLIIKSFGFDTVTTQLLLIPVYFWAAGLYTAISWLSDKYRKRALFMVPAALVTAVGYAINVGSSTKGALYFSTFLIGPGIYIIVGINSTWVLNCHAGYYKRATAIGLNQSLGNCAGIVVGQIFKSKVNGKYLLGLSFSLGAVCLAAIGHVVQAYYLNRQNKKRDSLSKEERARQIEQGKIGDSHPDFRYPL
jgi:MFS family permease